MIFCSFKLNAQTVNEGKNSSAETKSATSNVGIKQTTNQNGNSEQVSITPTVNSTSDQTSISAGQSQNNFSFDFSSMPPDVQKKVSENKTAGKNLFEGIEKVFTVEIKGCVSQNSTDINLNFLNNEMGFVRYEFLSEGKVKLIVLYDYDSVILKEKLLSAGLNFNFLNEYYLLK
jgi:hypothetical protein